MVLARLVGVDSSSASEQTFTEGPLIGGQHNKHRKEAPRGAHRVGEASTPTAISRYDNNDLCGSTVLGF